MKTKLSNEEIERVKTLAKDTFNGSKKLAVAAIIYGVGYVLKHGGQLPPEADKKQIASLQGQITGAEKPATNKSAAKSSKPKQSKKKL